MNVLIVGAGAVGQPYGYHLKQGGATVNFYVRPKYVDELRRGLVLYPLNRSKKPDPVLFDNFGVLTTPEEVAAQHWDLVWLCVSSTALRTGWFSSFSKAIGDATVVFLQPGLEDREWILQYIPEERLISGLITMISYQAPIDGESWPQPGIAYWFPPLSALPLSGSTDQVSQVVQLLKSGGCAARIHSNVGKLSGAPTAVLMPHLLALEAEGWSFDRLRRSQMLKLAALAAHEALKLVGKRNKTSVLLACWLTNPVVFRMGLRILPRFFPFDIEAYLRYHFTKVRDQTRMFVERYIALAKSANLPTDSLRTLARMVPD